MENCDYCKETKANTTRCPECDTTICAECNRAHRCGRSDAVIVELNDAPARYSEKERDYWRDRTQKIEDLLKRAMKGKLMGVSVDSVDGYFHPNEVCVLHLQYR